MGCCGSKQGEDELTSEDNRQNAVTSEKTPLLKNMASPVRAIDLPKGNIDQQAAAIRQSEQEALKGLVKKAADNLINLTAADAHPIHGSEVDDRRNQYSKIIGKVKYPSMNLIPKASLSSNSGSLAEVFSIDSHENDVEKTLSQVRSVTSKCKGDLQVQHVENMVIQLPGL